jgi:hypothetical protein
MTVFMGFAELGHVKKSRCVLLDRHTSGRCMTDDGDRRAKICRATDSSCEGLGFQLSHPNIL